MPTQYVHLDSQFWTSGDILPFGPWLPAPDVPTSEPCPTSSRSQDLIEPATGEFVERIHMEKAPLCCDLGSQEAVFQHHLSRLEFIFCCRSWVLEALFVQRSQLVWKELNILDLRFSWHVSAILYATHKLQILWPVSLYPILDCWLSRTVRSTPSSFHRFALAQFRKQSRYCIHVNL